MKNTTASIYEQLKSAGVSLDNHESDLYAQVTLESKVIVANYKFRSNVTVFTSQVDGQLWYDIPFAYEPFWEAKQRTSKGRMTWNATRHSNGAAPIGKSSQARGRSPWTLD